MPSQNRSRRCNTLRRRAQRRRAFGGVGSNGESENVGLPPVTPSLGNSTLTTVVRPPSSQPLPEPGVSLFRYSGFPQGVSPVEGPAQGQGASPGEGQGGKRRRSRHHRSRRHRSRRHKSRGRK